MEHINKIEISGRIHSIKTFKVGFTLDCTRIGLCVQHQVEDYYGYSFHQVVFRHNTTIPFSEGDYILVKGRLTSERYTDTKGETRLCELIDADSIERI